MIMGQPVDPTAGSAALQALGLHEPDSLYPTPFVQTQSEIKAMVPAGLAVVTDSLSRVRLDQMFRESLDFDAKRFAAQLFVIDAQVKGEQA
jgi:hypothetical protein